jgi:hypothetical protein
LQSGVDINCNLWLTCIVNCDITENGVNLMTAKAETKLARVVADFERGRIDSARAARLIKKLAAKGKARRNRRAWK